MHKKSDKNTLENSASTFMLMLIFLITASNNLVAQVEEKPLELWFDSPAGFWEEALPLGNGRTGAMVFGGVDSEQYSLNDHHLWSGGPVPGNEGSPEILEQVRQAVFDGNYSEADQIWRGMHGPYSARYLPLGDLFLEFPSDNDRVENYKRILDLRNALSIVTHEKDGVVYKRESFISHPDQVMVVRLSASEAGKISFNANLTSKLNHTVQVNAADHLILKGKTPAYVADRNYEPQQVQPPWGSNYTININTQMNFWPAEITNLSELHHSLFDFMEGLAVNGAGTAKVNYGIESGWLAHHNSDVWAKTSPPGGSDWDPKSSPRWSAWPMGGAWFTQHLWEY